MEYFNAIIITLLAGFSSLIGTLIVLKYKKLDKKKILYILSFTIGVILFITVVELVPETLEYFKYRIKPYMILPALFLSTIMGVSITFLFDALLKHDHNKEEHNLTHIGILTTLAVSFHKLPEAITLYIVAYVDIRLGILMALAISIHHIPEGIMISSPIYYETKSKLKAIKYTLYSCLINPIGIILAMFFSKYFTNKLVLGSLFGISIGMFIFLVFRELIPTILKYKNKKYAFISFLLGIAFMYVFHLILE